MTKFILYSIMLGFTYGCTAQKNNTNNIEKIKSFDIKKFEANKIKNEYIYTTADSTFIKEEEWPSEYLKTVSNKKSYYHTIYRYRKNGTLRMIVENYPNDFQRYLIKYDEEGNVTEEIDYDTPYTFTFEQVLAWIKKREIDMTSYDFAIYRGANEKESSWTVTWEKEDKSGLRRVFLDGTTGEIIEEFDVEYPAEEVSIRGTTLL